MTAVRVVAGVLRDRQGRVLLTQRPPQGHLGGLWEFPGGKLEPGESRSAALARELGEELGLEAVESVPLLRLEHRYPEKLVDIEFREVLDWRGEPRGREGQPLRWADARELCALPLPDADRPLLRTLSLPPLLLVTPEPGPEPGDFLLRLRRVLDEGVGMVQLRARGLSRDLYLGLAGEVSRLCRQYGARLLLNGPPELLGQVDADGIHLPSGWLTRFPHRPVSREKLLSVACHGPEELALGARLEADLALLSPVLPTPSHPDAPALGWEGFRRLREVARMPVYALGGLRPADLARARRHGAQGLAMIRGLWPDRSGPPAGP
ncbi:MAG: Nudix family hydrolase [Gammaproteobacteria bacterium]|nr:MAG: Nudix family hydrolase [Gammaproteobacteria bacterium]